VNAAVRRSVQTEKQQFVMLPLSVIRDPHLTPNDFRVLAVILSHDWEANDNGCTASQRTIAREAQASESTVKRSIKRLEASGYIFPPEVQRRGAERVGTIIRVTGTLRPNRRLRDASLPADQQLVLDSETPAKRTRVEPQPLTADDVHRLRQLDEWGCDDSEAYLCRVLGVIADREARLGRAIDAARLRAVYDGAAASRSLRKPGIRSVPDALRAGIERGYLLAHPRAPGEEEALRHLAARANDGAVIPAQTLTDYGVDVDEFADIRARVREEEEEVDSGSHGNPPLDEPLFERLRAALSPPIFGVAVNVSTIEVHGSDVTIASPNAMCTALLRTHVAPLLESWGYSASIGTA